MYAVIFFVLLFRVTPCLVVAVQPCMQWIPIKRKPFTRPSILDFCDKAKAFPIFGCSKNTLFHIWFFRGFATSQTDMHCICATNHHDLYHERVGLLPPVAFYLLQILLLIANGSIFFVVTLKTEIGLSVKLWHFYIGFSAYSVSSFMSFSQFFKKWDTIIWRILLSSGKNLHVCYYGNEYAYVCNKFARVNLW